MMFTGVVLDAPDARELAAFYHRLLGWPAIQDETDWVTLGAPAGGPGLSFQTESRYVPAGTPLMVNCPVSGLAAAV